MNYLNTGRGYVRVGKWHMRNFFVSSVLIMCMDKRFPRYIYIYGYLLIAISISFVLNELIEFFSML